MAGRLIQRTLRRSLDQVRYVSPVRPGDARHLIAAVYAQVEEDFGMLATPVALHSPAPGPLAASWIMLRETLVAAGRAGRTVKEAVAAGVSLANACPYCVAVHTTTLHGLSMGRDAAAIANDRLGSVADHDLRERAAWARATAIRAEIRQADGRFPAEQAPELVGVVVTFHYLNRMVNVFLDDTPLPPGTPGFAHGPMMWILGRVMGPVARRVPEPGASLDLLPTAPLPADLSWAGPDPGIAGGFARAAAAIEAAGERSVPESVRELLLTRLATWDGRPIAMNRAWVDEEVIRLSPTDRPAGRLTLLTALASYQVGPADIAEFRRDGVGDEKLIDLTSWASLTTARHMAGWIPGVPRGLIHISPREPPE